MKKVLSTAALLAITSNIAIAGGDFSAPVEPEVTIPEKEIVVVDDNVKYDGFYLGGALSYLRFNSLFESRGHALTLIGGYYFNKYLGVEARYTGTPTDVDVEESNVVTSRGKYMSNVGLYLKPMYNITTGFSAYGLAGYGQAHVGSLDDSGFQWGLGAKYELANGVGIFFDYMDLSDSDTFDGQPQDDTFSATSVGATYTF